MKASLNILLVADADDARLILCELERQQRSLSHEQVCTKPAMEKALNARAWDLIISDYAMRRFSGRAALELVQAMNPDIPFIVVSGKIGEQQAVEIMRAGAHDFILKGNLRRLNTAVDRELREAAERRKRRDAEAARFRSLIDQSPISTILYSPDGRQSYSNPAAAELWHMAPQRAEDVFRSHNILQDRQLMEKGLMPYIEKGFSGEFTELPEIQYDPRQTNPRYKGPVRWLQGFIYSVKDESGAIREIVIMHEDITTRKEMEIALSISEEQLKTIVSNMPVMMDAFDENGNIAAWNQECERVTGYSAEEVIGNPRAMEMFYPDAAYREKMIREWKNRGDNYRSWEWDLVCKDGQVKTISWSNISDLFPIAGWSTWGIGVDITKRKQAEEALRASEARYRNLVEHASDGIFITDAKGNYRDANTAGCTMLGYRRDEILQKNMRDLLPAEEIKTTPLRLKELLSGKTVISERLLKCKDGSLLPTEISARILPDGHLLGIVRDITVRKRTEAALRNRVRQQEVVAKLGQLALANIALRQLMSEIVSEVAVILKVDYCKILELLPDRNGLLLRAGVGWKDGLVGRAIIGAGQDSQAGYTLKCNEPVIVADLCKEKRFSGPPLLTEHGVVSGMSVVIAGTERPFGVLGAHTKEHRVFTGDDVHFLQAVANILAGKIARLKFEQENQRRLRDLTILNEASMPFGQALSVKVIGEKIIEVFERHLSWQRGSIWLIDQNGQDLRLLVHSRMGLSSRDFQREKKRVESLVSHVGEGISGWVAAHGQSIRTGDVSKEPRYIETDATTKSELCVPLKIAGRTIGAINVESPAPEAFNEHDERLLTTLANEAAIALENARLFEQVNQELAERKRVEKKLLIYQDQLRLLASELSLTEESERRRIAEELHDHIGQSLAMCKMRLGEVRGALSSKADLKTLDKANELVNLSIQNIRSLIFELSPPVLHELGFEAAIDWLAEHFQQEYRLAITVENDRQPKPLEAEMGVFLFKAIRELLFNITKYAQAERVNISLCREKNKLCILVEDNGVGFDLARLDYEPGQSPRFGLFNIRERLDFHGGQFKIASAPGQGTRVSLCAPLKN